VFFKDEAGEDAFEDFHVADINIDAHRPPPSLCILARAAPELRDLEGESFIPVNRQLLTL
jgi:hypothetical protein